MNFILKEKLVKKQGLHLIQWIFASKLNVKITLKNFLNCKLVIDCFFNKITSN